VNQRTWTRTALPILCGRCGRQLAKGDPVLVIELPGARRTLRFLRCDRCEGPAPPDLPALIVHGGIVTTPLVRLGAGMLPLDWKMRAAEREPGEEG